MSHNDCQSDTRNMPRICGRVGLGWTSLSEVDVVAATTKYPTVLARGNHFQFFQKISKRRFLRTIANVRNFIDMARYMAVSPGF